MFEFFILSTSGDKGRMEIYGVFLMVDGGVDPPFFRQKN